MPNIIKRDLIIALLRDENVENRLPFFLSFIRSKMNHDDFDAIFISPGFDSSVSQTRRFAFVPMDIKGHSFLAFAKFKDIMKHYLNVWCIDYSMLKHKNVFNLSDLDCNDIIFQCGNRKGEVESATYYGRSEAVRELLSFLEQRKSYNATENELVGRCQRRNGSPILIPQKKEKNNTNRVATCVPKIAAPNWSSSGGCFWSERGTLVPPNGYVFGPEVPCSEGFEPLPNRHLAHKEGAGSKTVLIMQSIVKSLGHMCELTQFLKLAAPCRCQNR